MARNSRSSSATAPATSPAAIAAEALGKPSARRAGRAARAATVRGATLTSSMAADGFRGVPLEPVPTGLRNRPARTIAVGKSRVRESERSSGAENGPLALERLDLGGRIPETLQHLARVLTEKRR